MDYERILVFGAHPDDEFSMAGTLAYHADWRVHDALDTMTKGTGGSPRP